MLDALEETTLAIRLLCLSVPIASKLLLRCTYFPVVSSFGPQSFLPANFEVVITGLVNPKCIGLIGSGVVIHLPSFFEELDTLESQGEPTVCATFPAL